jgi:hypothetical protein
MKTKMGDGVDDFGHFLARVQIGAMAMSSKRDPCLRQAGLDCGSRFRCAKESQGFREPPLGMTADAINLGALKLLQALRSGIVAEQIFENGEDVLAILDDAF